jgi:hypothetical protein
MEDETITCKACGAETDALAVFPGTICLACYSKTPAANAPMTGEQVTALFRKSVRR